MTLVLVIALSHAASPCRALDGRNALQLTTAAGWTAFELVTQGDDIAAIADPGYEYVATRGQYDGLGPIRRGDIVSIIVNHEMLQSSMSRVDVSRRALRQAVASQISAGATPFPTTLVTGMGDAYDAIYDGGYHAVNKPLPVAAGAEIAAYASENFYRFCSGTMYAANAFGPGRGFVDPMYITGEEAYVFGGGQLYALDPATRDLWEVAAVGGGSWENAAQIDAGDDQHVALLLDSDLGDEFGDYLRFYVGAKGRDANGDGAIDFLERNGLRGGRVYYFTPIDADPAAGLPAGSVAGTWSTSTDHALHDNKIEDVHTNPHNGAQAALGASNDGVFRLDFDLQFSAGEFDAAASTTVITRLVDDDVPPIGEPDNLVWSADGKIYLQEDGDGNEMWQLNADGNGATLIATSATEPSGIEDMSTLLGYEPGSVLISSIQGDGVAVAQLAVLVSPQAKPLAPNADFNGDGIVDGADFLRWQRGLGLVDAGARGDGDANHDGNVDAADLALWWDKLLAHSGAVNSRAVPEPAAHVLAALTPLAVFVARRRALKRLAASGLVVLSAAGCGGRQQQWEITFENKSTTPTSCRLTLGADGLSTAKVDNVGKGKPISLIAGDSPTIVQSITLLRGAEEQTLDARADLPVGKRFEIVVTSDGKLATTIADR